MVALAIHFTPPERERVTGHAYPLPAPDRRVTIEVLNASGRAGLARGATRVLRRRGLDVVFFGNADAPADSTRILVRRGDPGAGRDVRDALGLGRVAIEPDTLRRVDVSVILGRDFRIPVSDTQAYKQFGNSVVVPVVEEVARIMVPCVVEENCAER